MNDKTSELFDAAYAGDIDSVKICIDSGADVNAINSFGDTPLIEAIASDNAKNRVAIIKLLIEHGADPDYKGEGNSESAVRTLQIIDLIESEPSNQ